MDTFCMISIALLWGCHITCCNIYCIYNSRNIVQDNSANYGVFLMGLSLLYCLIVRLSYVIYIGAPL